MKIGFFCLGVICVCASLLAGSNGSGLSSEDVMQGFKLHCNKGREEHGKWLNDLYRKRAMLTNEAERIHLTKDLIRILTSEESSNQDKCAAAYLVGLFQFKEGIKVLVDNFALGNQEALNPDPIRLAEGERPAQIALIRLGEVAVPGLLGLIESTTNSYVLKLGAQSILFIKGQEDGVAFLKQAIAEQTDSKKKENLKAALSSEYFTDPKYRLSGPEDKVKLLLAREHRGAGVTNRPKEK